MIECKTGVILESPKNKPGIKISSREVITGLVVVVILYVLYSVFQPGVTTITTAQTLSFVKNGTQIIKIYNSSPIAIMLQSASNSSATFYVSKFPVLYGPVVLISLTTAGSANVSSTGTKTADMNIKLQTSSSGGATLMIAPLLSTFGISTSGNIRLVNPVSFGAGGNGNATFTTVASTTTATGSTTTIKKQTTTTVATTTVGSNNTAIEFQQALALMNSTELGKIMNGFNVLYQKDASCTSSQYNSTYNFYYSSHPPSPLSFYNISPFTPTKIKISEAAASTKNSVLITYSTVAPSPVSSGPAVLAIVNVSASTFLGSVSYTGLYSGWNLPTLNNTYSFQNKVVGPCGAYISPP